MNKSKLSGYPKNPAPLDAPGTNERSERSPKGGGVFLGDPSKVHFLLEEERKIIISAYCDDLAKQKTKEYFGLNHPEFFIFTEKLNSILLELCIKYGFIYDKTKIFTEYHFYYIDDKKCIREFMYLLEYND